MGDFFARALIHRMGESGQPPERGALRVNAGTTPTLDLLREVYLEPIAQGGLNSTFKVVLADFGGGKTHFLHCLREYAWREGFATALVGLSPKECPLHQPELVYREIVRNLELPPESEEEEPHPGLDAVLRRVHERRSEQHGLSVFLEWVESEIATAPIVSRSYRQALVECLRAMSTGEESAEQDFARWMLGEARGKSAYQSLGLAEELSSANAFTWLKALAQSLRALGHPGLLLLFDEVDRNLSLSQKKLEQTLDVIRQMVDACGRSDLPGVMLVYAAPMQFLDVVRDYPALEQRLRAPGEFSSSNPLHPVLPLRRIMGGDTALHAEIGARLMELYEQAWDVTFDRDLQRANLEALGQALGRNVLEVGKTRDFVKAAVALLTMQHRGEQRVLGGAEIATLASAEVPPPPGQELDGERAF